MFTLIPIRRRNAPWVMLLLALSLPIVVDCERTCTGPCERDEPEGEQLNGSFECSGRPTLEGWRFGNPELASSIEDAPPGGGRWCLRLEADWAPTLGFVVAPIPGVHDGDAIRLSAFVRAGNEYGGGSIALYVGKIPYRDGTLLKRAWTSESYWTHLSVEDTVSLAEGDSVWAILSTFDTEIAPRTGLFDLVVVDSIRE